MNPEVHLKAEELRRLVSLTQHPDWPLLVQYLGSVREAAARSLRKLSNNLQTYGYWSGVIQIVDDIENLPVDIWKIVHAEDGKGEEDEA